MIYEILYIIPSKFSDNEIDGVMESVGQTLEKNDVTIQETKNLGKIKLAYPIKKVSHGTYVLSYFEHDGSLEKIDQDLRLSDNVLRHIIIKREKGIPLMPFSMTSYQEPLSPEGKRNAPAKKPKPQKAVQEEEKLSVDDLDKQLDEILDSDLTNV